jgi:xylulokinase
MPDLILAIDLGTSGAKAVVTEMSGRVLAQESAPVQLALLPGGGAEQDPADWWRAIVQAVRAVLAAGPFAPERVAAVATTAQWGGTVAVDGNGQHLGNAIIWADRRGAPWVRAITGGWPTIEGYGVDKVWAWLRRTGGIPTRGGKDPIAHILFLKYERADIYQAAAHFLDIKDFLNLRLTGLAATSPDTVSIHWLTDNRRIDAVRYDATLLRMAGLDRRHYPPLRPATSILGPLLASVAGELGLRAGTPVVVGSADILAAAVGSGAVLEGQPHIHIGTSSWLSCHLPWKRTDILHNMATLPSPLPGHYLLVNEQDVAGGALAWLTERIFFAEDGLTEPAPADRFQRLDTIAATSPAGAHGVLFTPWLNGERSPVEDPYAGAGFHNLSLRSTRADMVRALLEGVALNTRWLLPYVESMARRRLGAMRLVGGGARSTLWCQIYADVLNRPIEQVEAPQSCSARGAALLAALALGSLRVAEIPAVVPVAGSFVPNAEAHRLYSERFVAFREIYRQQRRLFRRQNMQSRQDG